MDRRVQALRSRFAMTIESDPSTLDTWLTYVQNHINSIYASYLPRNNVFPPLKPINRAALELLWRSLLQTDFDLQCFILCIALFFTAARPSSLILNGDNKGGTPLDNSKDKMIMERGNQRLVDTMGPLSPTLASLERSGHLPSRGVRFLFLICPDGNL